MFVCEIHLQIVQIPTVLYDTVVRYWTHENDALEQGDVPGRSGKTNGIVMEAKCVPAEGENISDKQAGTKRYMPA